MSTLIPNWIKTPRLPITISIIGAGATGSLFATHLARLCYSANSLFKKDFTVTIIDGDTVKPHNIGRQAFYQSDLDMYKSEVVAARINRAYGVNWLAVTKDFEYPRSVKGKKLNEAIADFSSNIIISCTDTVKSRKQLHRFVRDVYNFQCPPEWKPLFWLDMGNTRTTGNVIVGSHEVKWPDIVEAYGDSMKESKRENTCSLALSLNEQDLFINPMCALIGAKWVWECLSKPDIGWRGAFINLETFNIKKLSA